jgi:annexin A7/11
MKWCLEEGEEEYDHDKHNDSKAEEDAERLHEMGEGRLGTNERGLFRLLCTAPPKHLQAVNEKYKQKYGHDLIEAIKNETSGVIEKATVFFIGMKIDPYKQIATMIHDAVKGIGTNELLLTTYIIRYQKIMDQVDEAYQALYKSNIKRVIKFETTGQFERLLCEIAGAD